MIKKFNHKGLEKLYHTGATAGVKADHIKRLRLILSRLDASTRVEDMNLPGLRLHSLKGKHKGLYAVNVSGNWRVVFRFVGIDVFDIDYLDYH